jgi:hypothetical protein
VEVQLKLGPLSGRSVGLVYLLLQSGNLIILGDVEIILNTKLKYKLYHVTLKLAYGFHQCSSILLFFFEVLLFEWGK